MPKARRPESQDAQAPPEKISKGDRIAAEQEVRDRPDTSELLDTALSNEGLPDTGRASDFLDPRDIAGTQGPLLQEVVDASEDEARGEFAAETQDFEQGQEFIGEVREGIQTNVTAIDERLAQQEGTEADVMARLRGAHEQIQAIPGKVEEKFGELSDRLATLSESAFDRLDSQEAVAIGEIQAGKNAALSAAVNGIQGNINQAIAQIQADPNMTSAQKASMISRTRMSGASALAPAVGAHILEFNTLTATTRSNFASVGASVQNTMLGLQGGLLQAEGNAFAAAQTAVGKLTTELLATEANTAINFANSQTQLLTARSVAINSGHQLMGQMLSEFRTPHLDLTGTMALLYSGFLTIANDTAAQNAALAEFDINTAIAIEGQGTHPDNVWAAAADAAANQGLEAGAFVLVQGLAEGPPDPNTLVSNIVNQ